MAVAYTSLFGPGFRTEIETQLYSELNIIERQEDNHVDIYKYIYIYRIAHHRCLIDIVHTIFSDSAKAIAPLKPANHNTTDILAGILLDLSRHKFATNVRGKILIARPIKQATNATIEKVRSQF